MRVWALARGVDRQMIGEFVVMAQARAAFDGMAETAMHEQVFAHDMCGILERGIDIAITEMHFGGRVVGRIHMCERSTGLTRGAAIARRRQRFVIDHHECGRILGDIAVVGDDDGDGLADMTDLILRQHIRHDVLRHMRVRHAVHAHIVEALGQVGQGIDRMHAGYGLGHAFVDAVDLRVRLVAAHERRMQHVGQVEIVDEAAFAGQQRRIFQPLDGLADLRLARNILEIGDRIAHERAPARIFCAASSAASTMP